MPEEANVEVDLRVPTHADAEEIVAQDPQPEIAHEGVTVKVDGRNEPPALRKGQCRRRAVRARQDARRRDRLRSGRTSTGGGSDGNFTAALGIPTLDGLGVDGKGAHTHYEQIYISSIEPRAKLLHRLFQTLR